MIDGVLIDPATKEITPVQLEPGDLDRIYQLLDCDRFAVAWLNDGAVVYVDDEGLLKPNSFFFHEPTGQFLAGRGLVLGDDSSSSPLTPDQLKTDVDFGEPMRIGGMLMFMGDRIVREIK